jgi:hypothetical protein
MYRHRFNFFEKIIEIKQTLLFSVNMNNQETNNPMSTHDIHKILFDQIALPYSRAILSLEEMITQAINLVEKTYPTEYKQVADNKPSELYAFCNTKLRQLITPKNYVDSDDSDDEENEEEQH